MGTKRSHQESIDDVKGKGRAESPSKSAKKVALSPIKSGKEEEVTMTVEETKLYDRQIRLWGLEAQTRMRRSKILIVGCSGLSNETIKNLVLAGVGSVTVMDHKKVVASHLGAQFFVSEEDIGKNIAECVVKRASLLNPSVKMTPDTSALSSKKADFFSQFELVCLIGQSIQDINQVNQICREKKIPFWSSSVNGVNGYIFCDLVEHDYVEEQKITKKGEPDAVEQRSKSATFCSWKEALAFGFDALNTSERRFRRKAHPLYFAYLCCWKFEDLNGRAPVPGKDDKALLTLKSKVLKEVQVNAEFLPDKTILSLAKNYVSELAPACAVMGGFLAQEVLKVLSRKEAPFNNIMVYDAWDSTAFVMTLGNVEKKGVTNVPVQVL